MNSRREFDCIVIGYNELPFEEYESLLRNYGEDSEVYRDLKFSFIDLDGKKLNYVDLLNHVFRQARPDFGIDDEFKSGDIPNLAAIYLTNFLRKRNFRATYINLFQYEKKRLAAYLAQDPLCVAITTTFYVLNLPVIDMVKFIREHNEQVKIIIGGPLVSNHFNRNHVEQFTLAVQDIGADIYVISSQGEHTLAQIVQCLKCGDSLRSIPNIAYMDGSSMQINELLPEDNSLDQNAIDWCNFNDIDLGPTLQTRTARSCAFSCSFCAYPARAGKLTYATIDTIEHELNAMRKVGAQNVVFIDDTFNVPLKRFKELCRTMIKNRYQFNWFSYFRCSNSDQEAIELMAQSGCKGVFLGIESGSPAILENMHKAAAVEQYRKGIALLKQHGILTFGSFIMGFPGETDATVAETMDFIKDTRPDYYRTQLWYCEPGTPIYNQRDKYRIKGEGFNWQHETMESLEAMDHIDHVFLGVDDSIWLPQWSFDFWFIPYILGRGISLDRFRALMKRANELLSFEIAYVPPQQKRLLQRKCLDEIVDMVRTWR